MFNTTLNNWQSTNTKQKSDNGYPSNYLTNSQFNSACTDINLAN